MTRKSFPVRATGGEIRDLEQPGYYPGFSTMSQKGAWDEATREVVTDRVDKAPPPIRFFSAAEATLMTAIIERLIPQDDRAPNRTIPILPVIDKRLYTNSLNGFRYEDMPPDRDAYRMGIRAIDEMAQERFQQHFADLAVHRQELILKSVHDGEPEPDNPVWKKMSVHRFWALMMEDCVTAYYSHPWAWDEIGFGGPAYPRGYMRLEHGEPEPWEKRERRYDWIAPPDSLSDPAQEKAPPEHGSLQGHGGTH